MSIEKWPILMANLDDFKGEILSEVDEFVFEKKQKNLVHRTTKFFFPNNNKKDKKAGQEGNPGAKASHFKHFALILGLHSEFAYGSCQPEGTTVIVSTKPIYLSY